MRKTRCLLAERVLGLLAFTLTSAFAPAALAQATPAAAPAPAAPAAPTSAGRPPAEAVPASVEPTSESEPGDVAAAHSATLRAYQKALAARKLAATQPLSTQRIKDELVTIEEMLGIGRRDEAIGALVYIIESPRFEPFATTAEGRSAVFLLGDALGRGGAYDLSRSYLLRLLDAPPSDTWYRQAVRSLVDFGLESDEPQLFLGDLKRVPGSAGEELSGDIAYLSGRTAEHAGKVDDALGYYARVAPRSRFWAQATYLSGVIEVERQHFKRGENLFCKVADPKLTPKKAAVFGGGDFFRVRDLARLGLGRVAHEQYRFDDARYYYYLVPADSERLPEALYETATTRYEAKDYQGARESMDDLKRVSANHPYQDEAWILDAYIDLAVCRFPQADDKLKEFIKRYEPVRDAARLLTKDDSSTERLVDTVRRGEDPASANLGVTEDTSRALSVLLRVDAGYGHASRRLAELDHQINGLERAMGDLDQAQQRLTAGKEVKPSGDSKLNVGESEQLSRAEAQLSEVQRLIREAERAGGPRSAEVAELRKQAETLDMEVRAARAARGGPAAGAAGKGEGLADLLAADRARAGELYGQAAKLREQVRAQQLVFARDAFVRLDKRLTRLLRRARLGRIETVLGKKRALEIEVEALSQGLLPQTIVDSLDAERYLQDDEEYWPFEGEDWADEYVGGESLK
ncbi:MAG TPA: hypothetical protein VGP93_17945 [Polyangiaceae bacterium]|nr:hypothetical protein [Polyangiaceae bacterium]